MADKADKNAVVRKRVEFLPDIPTGEVSPEERRALKVNNPEAFANLERYEKAQAETAAPADAPAAAATDEEAPPNKKNGGTK